MYMYVLLCTSGRTDGSPGNEARAGDYFARDCRKLGRAICSPREYGLIWLGRVLVVADLILEFESCRGGCDYRG